MYKNQNSGRFWNATDESVTKLPDSFQNQLIPESTDMNRDRFDRKIAFVPESFWNQPLYKKNKKNDSYNNKKFKYKTFSHFNNSNNSNIPVLENEMPVSVKSFPTIVQKADSRIGQNRSLYDKYIMPSNNIVTLYDKYILGRFRNESGNSIESDDKFGAEIAAPSIADSLGAFRNRPLPTLESEISNNYSFLPIDNFKKYFPFKENINKQQLMITNTGVYSITHTFSSKKIINIIKNLHRPIPESTGSENNEYVSEAITHEATAHEATAHELTIHEDAIINKPINEYIVLDMTAGVGGDTLNFAMEFGHIHSVEFSPLEYYALKNNIDVFKMTNINTYLGNSVEMLLSKSTESNEFKNINFDIIYADPEWGGPNFKYKTNIHLYIGGLDIEDITNEIFKRKLAKIVIYKVPPNFHMHSFKENVSYFKFYKKIYISHNNKHSFNIIISMI
jgi:16S rRNA G966 N2-methylase RsmD